MNDQLQNTLHLFSGGIENVDPNLAVTHLRAWQAALIGQPGAELLGVGLGRVAEQLQAGQYPEAAASLPDLGAEVDRLAALAPEADRAGLTRLGELLRRAGDPSDAPGR